MEAVLTDIWLTIWFFLPAGAANGIPVLAAKAPWLRDWAAPLDAGLSFRGRRLLGANKTWRGLLAGLFAATAVLWLQQLIIAHVGWTATLSHAVDYAHLPTLIVGPLFGLGALGGDAVKSFFKRQRGVAPGEGWFPFDQIDYIIGGALATAPFVHLSLRHYVWLLVLWLGIHVLATYGAYKAGLRDKPI